MTRAPVAAAPARPAVDGLDFALPDGLLAHEPPEARGLARDEVRLLVSDPTTDDVRHARFRDIGDHLRRGDLLVVNESATIAAAVDGWRAGAAGAPDELIAVHLSSPAPHDRDPSWWVIELRRRTAARTTPLFDVHPGEGVRLRGGGTATPWYPYVTLGDAGRLTASALPRARLWVAELQCVGGVAAYAARYGSPIRYGYVPEAWPLSDYQTVFAREPGSAEMPSAGRPFTTKLVATLESAGVRIARVVLHTGVASQEVGERPYPERYRVSADAAHAVNLTRRQGGRVIAVGTTVVRALESVASTDGTVQPSEGWTNLVITPERGVQVVDGLITGLHEPRATHLALLEAIAGRRHLEAAYAAALRERYLWHEFGDSHLILP